MSDSIQLNEQLSELDQEWLLLNAIRQTLSFGNKAEATYQTALLAIAEIAPELLRSESELNSAFLDENIRLYQQRAKAQSNKDKIDVSPISIIDKEIENIENDLRNAPEGENEQIGIQLNRLSKIKSKLLTEKWTENQAIQFDQEFLSMEYKPNEYTRGGRIRRLKLPNGRALQIRLLHPDRPEWKSGVDLIYENYWKQQHFKSKAGFKTVVRIAALQYKMWNGISTNVLSDTRAMGQLKKMQDAFCDGGLCKGDSAKQKRYRLPCCSGFLRLTDRMQNRSGFTCTHAWHVPICTILKFADDENKHSLSSKELASSSISQRCFPELFNRNMLGSSWIESKKLDAIYKRAGIIDTEDSVLILAQEF